MSALTVTLRTLDGKRPRNHSTASSPSTSPLTHRAPRPVPTASQPSSRPKLAPYVVEETLDNKERWERLVTLKPTQPQKNKVSQTQKCLTCKGTMVVEENAHGLVYAICKNDDTMSIPCYTTDCKGWLPPTLRSGARKTCPLCCHIYYRCACRQLHVVPASEPRYSCKVCNEQVVDYPCRES